MHIAIITAGGAGMFCGSCMHDNSWARALKTAGVEVTLLPTYTPLTLDEPSQSEARVFLGGINVYLEHLLPVWKRLPGFLRHRFDAPWLLRAATVFGVSNSAEHLGPLTVELLSGESGPQSAEIDELVRFLSDELRPDVVIFSNSLLAGVIPALRRRSNLPVWVVLQGDDIFLKDLPEPFRGQAIDAIRQQTRDCAGFITHSDYYAQHMSHLLGVSIERFARLPLSIDLAGHDGQPKPAAGDSFRIGYFARVCPEKGLLDLVNAVLLVRQQHPEVRLVAGGYLGKRDHAYLQQVKRAAAPMGDAFEYVGSPVSHEEKVSLLKTFDLLSVPTNYREPKGLYVLEALANGVPVVQPEHGAFPEVIATTGGGLTFPPGDSAGLASAISRLISNTEERIQLATRGREAVHGHFSGESLARRTVELFSHHEFAVT